jgi:hypothetical protein
VVVPPQLAAAVELAEESQSKENEREACQEPENEVELRAKIFMGQSIIRRLGG